MSKPTVSRKSISLEENSIQENFAYVVDTTPTYWVSSLDGRLTTGEYVRMSRTSVHAGEALLLLTEAIEANGWGIRE